MKKRRSAWWWAPWWRACVRWRPCRGCGPTACRSTCRWARAAIGRTCPPGRRRPRARPCSGRGTSGARPVAYRCAPARPGPTRRSALGISWPWCARPRLAPSTPAQTNTSPLRRRYVAGVLFVVTRGQSEDHFHPPPFTGGLLLSFTLVR